MEDSIDKELNSLEEIEPEDKLFSQMIEEHYRYIDNKKRVGFRWFVCLWIGWVLCLGLSPIIDQRLGLSEFLFFPTIPLIYTLLLVQGQWKYFVPLERGEAILNFIHEDWSRPVTREKFSELSYRFSTSDYRYKLLKLHSALTIILQGYDEKCRISGFQGLKPVVSRLQLLSDHLKGKDRKPRPWIYPDGSILINPPFD